jgi:hypothetical protein
MSSPRSDPDDPRRSAEPPPDFSLVLGGPLFQLLRKARLSDDGLRLASRRLIAIPLIAWLPLLVLAALEGQALGGSVPVPFLMDLEVHIRFFLALPLLIAAEPIVHQRLRSLVRTFLERELIPPDSMERFGGAIRSAFRLRNSVVAELLLVGVVYVVGIVILWRQFLSLDVATWYAAPSNGGSRLSMAGVWYGYVSLPIFQFLLLRWYFRTAIWIGFLWRVSRLDLRLIPTHPDRVAGLGFLSQAVYAFSPLAVAHGAMLAGMLANRIFFMGAELSEYGPQIAALLVFVLALILGPLLLFAPPLATAKREGLREYGTLAERGVREFDAKWLRGGAAAGVPLVGNTDVQSLADLANSYDIVRTMRAVPVTRDTIVQITVAALGPIVPLVLTMMPLDEVLRALMGVMF